MAQSPAVSRILTTIRNFPRELDPHELLFSKKKQAVMSSCSTPRANPFLVPARARPCLPIWNRCRRRRRAKPRFSYEKTSATKRVAPSLPAPAIATEKRGWRCKCGRQTADRSATQYNKSRVPWASRQGPGGESFSSTTEHRKIETPSLQASSFLIELGVSTPICSCDVRTRPPPAAGCCCCFTSWLGARG